MPNQSKPHPMAFRLDTPCVCGSVWGRPGVDFSDACASEYAVIPLCAQCKRRLAEADPEPCDHAWEPIDVRELGGAKRCAKCHLLAEIRDAA